MEGRIFTTCAIPWQFAMITEYLSDIRM